MPLCLSSSILSSQACRSLSLWKVSESCDVYLFLTTSLFHLYLSTQCRTLRLWGRQAKLCAWSGWWGWWGSSSWSATLQDFNLWCSHLTRSFRDYTTWMISLLFAVFYLSSSVQRTSKDFGGYSALWWILIMTVKFVQAKFSFAGLQRARIAHAPCWGLCSDICLNGLLCREGKGRVKRAPQ